MECIPADLSKTKKVNTNGRSECEGITCLDNKDLTILASFKRLETILILHSRIECSRAMVDKTVRIFGQFGGRTKPRDGIWDRRRPSPMLTARPEPE